VRVILGVGVRETCRVCVRVGVFVRPENTVLLGVGVTDGARVIVELAVAVVMNAIPDVTVGVAVSDGAARVFVGVTTCLVGGGVIVTDGMTRTMVSVAVWVEELGRLGVRVRSGDTFVEIEAGVGVNRNTPVTATSVPIPYPSSSRISSNAAEFIGAFTSNCQD
jgi:hypothetical protein